MYLIDFFMLNTNTNWLKQLPPQLFFDCDVMFFIKRRHISKQDNSRELIISYLAART